jgi:hypothetical protein
MKQREFNKWLNGCCKTRKGQKVLDKSKLAALPEETKTAMVFFLVRHRGPILAELLTEQVDRSWLACCGYVHQTTGKQSGNTFLHTCEHRII